jgi:2-polyprenyl-3-methyl-5-hydroxy-6-metoxy-1,4-benzoquinol methylase
MSDPIATLQPIMEKHGVTCPVDEFHSAVNITFHEFESEVYDELHTDMWESLPEQFSLLADDCVRECGALPERFDMLDIGCGTGLASSCILKSSLGPRVTSLDLLDTSPRMLERARQKAASWKVPSRTIEGTVETLAGSGRNYGLIVTCSVLHHVPDLSAFVRSVRTLQNPGGVFLHIQDPNGDYLADPECKQRIARMQHRNTPGWLQRLEPGRVLGRIKRELTGQQGQDYISKTNRALIAKGVIRTPLTVHELFSITDIHVQDEQGISIAELRTLMPDYRLVSQRSYGFFGQLASTLPPDIRVKENELIAARALNGFHVGALWQAV